ncbi:MAG: GrpB family protein [Candidatus Dormibacteraceae bacterium]
MEDDLLETWRRMRLAGGESVTIIDLYELVARSRGIRAEELPVDERRELGFRAMRLMDPRFEIVADSDRLDPEPIELAPYDPVWPARFEAWRLKLVGALPVVARRIAHVGSTAVPGLSAKPVIDVQVSVDDQRDESGYVPAVEAIGVQLRNRDSDHRYFRPFTGRPRDVHIHVCSAGGEWERRHLLFRDYLRASAEARNGYWHAKKQAVARWSDDRLAYTEAKDATIRRITEAAEAWAREKGWSVNPAG